MKRTLLIAACVAAQLIAPAVALTQVPVGTPEVQFGSGPQQWKLGEPTEVRGDIPDTVLGTWLVVENLDLSKVKTMPAVRMYRLERKPDGALQAYLLPLVLPEAVGAEVRKAEKEVVRWNPTAEQVAAIRTAVRADAPKPDPERKVRHALTAATAFDEKQRKSEADIQKAKPGKPALLAIQFAAQETNGALFGGNYFIDAISSERLAGRTKSATVPLNPAGIPIPLGFYGVVEFIRLDAGPAAAALGGKVGGAGSQATPAAADAKTPKNPS